MLKSGKLRPREGKDFSWGHTVNPGQSPDWVPRDSSLGLLLRWAKSVSWFASDALLRTQSHSDCRQGLRQHGAHAGLAPVQTQLLLAVWPQALFWFLISPTRTWTEPKPDLPSHPRAADPGRLRARTFWSHTGTAGRASTLNSNQGPFCPGPVA